MTSTASAAGERSSRLTAPIRPAILGLIFVASLAVAGGCGDSVHRGADRSPTTTVGSFGVSAPRATTAPLSLTSTTSTSTVTASTSTTGTANARPAAPTTTAVTTTVPVPVPTTVLLPRYLASYHGGPVVHDPVVHLLVWGSGYPTATRRAVEHFLGGLRDSAYGAVLAEYFDTHGRVDNDITLADTWVETQKPPAAPTVEQVQAEISRAVIHAHWTVNANAVVMVLLPPGVSAVPRGGGSCGYHTAASASFLHQTAPAIVVAAYPSGPCDFGIGDAGGITEIASHELAEAVTDPFNAGWEGRSGWWNIGGPPLGEAADACEPAASFLKLSNGGTAAVSNVYGLQQGQCVSYGPAVA